MKTPKIEALTGVRFLFAALVVLYHLNGSNAIPQLGLLPTLLLNPIRVGFIGVQFFFVLSGFILAYNYPDIKAEDSKRFYIARFARIYPMLIFAFLFSGPLMFAHEFKTGMTTENMLFVGLVIISAFLALQAFIPPIATAGNGPAWSLSVESFFYALFPRLMRSLREATTGRLVGSLFFLLIISQGIALTGYYTNASLRDVFLNFDKNEPGLLDNGGKFFVYFPLFRLPEFITGMIFGILYTRNVAILKYHWLLCVGGGLILAALIIPSPNAIPFPMLNGGLLMIPTGLILWGLTQENLFSKILSLPFIVLLGEASYSLYLLHYSFLQYFRYASQKYLSSAADHPWLLTLAFLTVVTGVSILTYKYIEIPSRRWILARVGRRQPSVVPVSTGGPA